MITNGRGGLPCIVVENGRCSGEIYLHGAHVTRWRPHNESDVLWTSTHAVFAAETPIRGGVPICWPWFGPHPSSPDAKAHGFARTLPWTLETIAHGDASTRIRLSLRCDDRTRALWPHEFELTLDAAFGATLDLDLTTRNIGSTPFAITEALHTYLAVSDVRRIAVDGLAGVRYVDKVQDVEAVQDAALLTFASETDRVYATEDDCVLIDGARRIRISKRRSGSTVVWNPWIAKAARMTNFGDEEWTGMLCIEAANALDAAVTLAPGEAHTMGMSAAVCAA